MRRIEDSGNQIYFWGGIGVELGGFSEFYPLVPQIPVFFPEF